MNIVNVFCDNNLNWKAHMDTEKMDSNRTND